MLGITVLDQSPGCLSTKKLELLLEHLGNEGVILEIGYGMGEHSVKIKEIGVSKLVSIDRQFHPVWYTEWTNENNNIDFVRTDARNLPFGDRSVQVAILHFVTQYVSESGLTNIVSEASRVLKENGILAVGPQHEDSKSPERVNDDLWRFFVKTKNSRGTEMLKRITVEQLGIKKD